ncbi:MAG: preprotein translocase subunit SecG [Spirochaetaceae bacterium]|jgi:preprotein translocase subunit SecG|nr:preprotein translocase subunit SecG [Spirochaetaceae bacterium]
MGVLSGFLLVLFIIVSIFIILLVLVQNEDGDSMGGLFAGGSNTAFGSRSGNILSKASSILGILFFALAFSIAIINRTPGDAGVEAAGRQSGSETDWFLEEETAPPSPGAEVLDSSIEDGSLTIPPLEASEEENGGQEATSR